MNTKNLHDCGNGMYTEKIPKKYKELNLNVYNWRLYKNLESKIKKFGSFREYGATKSFFSTTKIWHGMGNNLRESSDRRKWFFISSTDDMGILNYGVGSGISYSTYDHNKIMFINQVGIFRIQDTDPDIIRELVPKDFHKYFEYSELWKSEHKKKVLKKYF